MNAIQFIKDHGVEKAREVVGDAPDWAIFWITQGEYHISMLSFPNMTGHHSFLITNLKRLVASMDMVELLGGIKSLNALVNLSNSPFALSHITREGVIYSIDEIKKAIADYESIYGGEHV